MQPLQEKMAQFAQGDLTEETLFRALIGHQDWWVPGTRDEDSGQLNLHILRHPDGTGHMQLFTSQEAMLQVREKIVTAEGYPLLGDKFLSVEGKAVFRFLEPSLDRLTLDPHSPHSLSFEAGDIMQLRRWAVVGRLEDMLTDPEQEEDPWTIMRRYPWYQVLLEGETEADHAMILAPDSEGRRLAAIFTTDDATQAFLDQVGDQLEGRAAIATSTGEELFVSLKQLDLDGMVFNCCGPTATRAFGIGVLDVILS